MKNDTARYEKHFSTFYIVPTCKICGMGFKESPRLKTHILTAHQGIKFSCDICGKEYLDRRGLNRHKQNVHGNVNVIVKEDITE